jgi:hypothetical protein
VTRPRRWLTAHRRPSAALSSAAILMLASGCVASADQDAREKITTHIDKVAVDATEWAQQDQSPGVPPGVQDVLMHIVAIVHANARELGSEVRNSDPDGTGSLGEVRLVLEGTGSGWLWPQDQDLYIFCARFVVTRASGQPRTVSAHLVDCPPDALPSEWLPTAPATPVRTPS